MKGSFAISARGGTGMMFPDMENMRMMYSISHGGLLERSITRIHNTSHMHY